MSRPGQAVGATAARLLGLLAVVLGLLAVHGLASGHHVTAAAAGHDGAAVLVVDEPPEAHGTAAAQRHGVGAAMAAMPPETGSSAGPVAPRCDADCLTTAVAAVCVVVLAGAAAAALARAAAARRSPLQTHIGRGQRARVPAPPRRLLPPLDPVAELCVSRT